MDYTVRVYKYEKVFGVIEHFDSKQDALEFAIQVRGSIAQRDGYKGSIPDRYYFEIEEYEE